MAFQWRHQYDDARDQQEGDAVRTVNNEPSLTEQHHAKDADINEIMRRFGVTDGAIPPAAPDPRYYGDFSDVPDFRQALDNTREALARFEALPAAIRNRFSNDPVELYRFVMNPANADEAVTLGLLKKEEPIRTPVTDPVPSVT